jgi:hypothetical protein
MVRFVINSAAYKTESLFSLVSYLIVMNVSGSEHESISRNSPEITNETHSKQQDQTESETEEDSRQELTEDEMLSQGIAHF